MRFIKWTSIIGMKKIRLVNETKKIVTGSNIVHIESRVIIKRGYPELKTHNKTTRRG